MGATFGIEAGAATAFSEPVGTGAGQLLADFMSFVTRQPDADTAAARGVERVAELIGAELVCITRPGVEPISAGLEREHVAMIAPLLCEAGCDRLELPEFGLARLRRKPLDDSGLEWLVVARVGCDFSAGERDLLRGMARVIGMARDVLMRQRLLERVGEIQRCIVRRDSIDEIVELVVAGATELTGSDVALLRQAESGADGPFTVKSCIGLSEQALDTLMRSPGRGLSRRAQQENRLVIIDDYQAHPAAHPVIKAEGVRSMVGAPVGDGTSVTGALVVASRADGRSYSPSELAALKMFAEHTSMALADARLIADTVHRSLHDALTGLPNRALFAERLGAAMDSDQGPAEPLAVLFVDIDRFKTVNDSLGHEAGDELLIAAAERLRRCVRAPDTAARLGGDEFAVLIRGADEFEGERVARRILAEFGRPFRLAGRELSISVSIGVAVGRTSADAPLRDADLAMYAAKTNGRGQAAIFSPGMRAAVRDRLELETDLRGAAGRDELFLEYQPIVDLQTQRITMVEALVRWQHRERGRLEPGSFLAMAEETGEIRPLGRWVLHAACRQAVHWRRLAPGGQLSVAVNISAAQLHTTDIVTDVVAALDASGLPPGALVLELTETAIMADVESATARLTLLHELGVSLAIDDFGTGYCSLEYLQLLPVDYLKIARPFLAELTAGEPDLRLIRAIATLGRSCEIRVVGEGIEHAGQLSALLEVGCGLGQGFLLGMPQDAAALEARLLPGPAA